MCIVSTQVPKNAHLNRKSTLRPLRPLRPTQGHSIDGRCARTTSRELGVRICGMQVWNAHAKGYVFQDKYYGRDLRAGEPFKEALRRYITATADDGKPQILTHHIPTILSRITQLGKVPQFSSTAVPDNQFRLFSTLSPLFVVLFCFVLLSLTLG